MANTLRVGVVGLGFGKHHLHAAITCGADIAYICDTDTSLLEKCGAEYGIPLEKQTADWHVLAEDQTVDAVILAVPDQLHREMCVTFLDAGKHVLCEKPLALTNEDMAAIIAAADRSGAKCMVGQICRFTPAFKKAKELIDAGTIGELYYVESEYAHDYEAMFKNPRYQWRTEPLRHGVVGGGCHAVDLLRWIAGDPKEVFAYGTHKLLPMVSYDDTTISVLKFENGVIGKVFVSTGCKRNYTMRSLFYGTRGTIICDNKSDTMQLFTVGKDGVNVNSEPTLIPLEINNHNTVGEFEVFAEHILQNTPVQMSAREGAKSVAVCLAIVKSSEEETPIRPSYEF